MKENGIKTKIIVHTLKTPQDAIQYLFDNFDNVLLVVNTDIEYFFNEFFYKKTSILDIANISFRDDEGGVHITASENVNYSL